MTTKSSRQSRRQTTTLAFQQIRSENNKPGTTAPENIPIVVLLLPVIILVLRPVLLSPTPTPWFIVATPLLYDLTPGRFKVSPQQQIIIGDVGVMAATAA